MPFVPGLGQVVLVNPGLNDIRYGSDGNSTYLAEFQSAFHVIMSTLTCGTKVNQSDATFAYPTGTWTANNADTDASGGTQSFSSTAGASFTYTVPSGVTSVALAIVGFAAGTQITWTVNGAGSTTKTYASTSLGGLGYTRCVEKFTGLNTGDVITGTRVAQNLIVDGALIPSATPPPIFWLLPTTLATWSGASPTAGTTPNRDALAAWVKTQTATYPSLRVIDPMSPPSGVTDVWNPATMIGSDTVHPNDRGHDYLARCLFASLSTLTFPLPGLHN
jgi:hypothetical protein